VGSSRVRRGDVRVLSATNVDVQDEVAQGRFREDLLYRLNTVEIRLPPLRERREDIPLLAAHFLERQAARYGRRVTLGADAMTALLEHPWPGNVRELEHVVERALLLCAGDVVHAADLLLTGGHARAGGKEGGARFDDLTLDEAERYLMERSLDRFAGNVSDAARALGLSRSAFYRRLAHHGLKGHG
ncbi:MAG TPA: helix-turn-helix domain-containing protein, partial [Polyangia bacterium]